MRLVTLLALLPVFVPYAAAAPEECVIEDGFDYVGNDLFSQTAVNALECCRQCQKFAKAGCRAFSWTDYQGGTCWLKKGRGTVEVNANAKSGTIATFRFSETCVLEHGIDYEGNDMASVHASKAGDCCAACQQLPGCRAFTFTTHDGGTCWLKSAKGNMVIDLGAISAQLYLEEPTCGLEQDVEYIGNNIGSALAADAGECCSLCEGFGGCRAFTWNDFEGGTCWFKNRKDALTWEFGVKSGQVFANPEAPSCAMERSVEFVGNDIGNASGTNAYGCCSICMKTVGCRAFSWADRGAGVCYLKSAKGDKQVSTQFVSSVV
jgi:hypothetical protein